MAEPLTEQEYDVRKSMMECIEGMHEPPYDNSYDQMTVNVGEMLRLYATIESLRARVPTSLSEIKAWRREEGRCLLCGATRHDSGEGCYKWNPGGQWRKVWAPHSWPEDEPERG